MLGMPRYAGGFDFCRKRPAVPDVFPEHKSSIDMHNTRSPVFVDRLDNNNIIYSTDKRSFSVVGKERYWFRLPRICYRLVAGGGKAYILTKTHMHVYSSRRVRTFEICAVDVALSPFNEVFVLTSTHILIFNEHGLKESFPYEGNAMFIHFYLFRELLVVDRYQVFLLNLNRMEVSLLHASGAMILATVFRDRLYIRDSLRFTSLDIENRVGESISADGPLHMAVGDTLVALYSQNGSFLFCDRHDIKINQGIVYNVPELVGFFFVGTKCYFMFEDRFVMWNGSESRVIDVERSEKKDYVAAFRNLDAVKKEHMDRRRDKTAVLRPNGVFATLMDIVASVFGKKKTHAVEQPRKRARYVEKRGGGF